MKTSKCTSECIFTRKFTKKQKQAHFGKGNKSIFPNNVKPDLNNIKVTYPENSNQDTRAQHVGHFHDFAAIRCMPARE